MSEMVERVARVICEKEGWEAEGGGAFDEDAANWRNFIPAALAAIAAMREPNLRMITAGQAIDGDEIDVWRAMNDAALAP